MAPASGKKDRRDEHCCLGLGTPLVLGLRGQGPGLPYRATGSAQRVDEGGPTGDRLVSVDHHDRTTRLQNPRGLTKALGNDGLEMFTRFRFVIPMAIWCHRSFLLLRRSISGKIIGVKIEKRSL